MSNVVDDKQRDTASKWCAQIRDLLKLQAKGINKNIRWTKKKRPWQTQTSLITVVNALDDLEADPTPDGIKAVYKAIQDLPKEKQDKYKDALDDLRKELDKTVVESTATIRGDVNINKIRTANGNYHFQTEDGVSIASDLTESRATFVHNVMGGLARITRKTGIQIDDMQGLLESIVKDPKMGLNSGDLEGTVWQQAMDHVTKNVIPGIKKDTAKLQKSGLIPKGAKLKGMKFTGSDFHKGGKQVLILRFDDKGTEKKVVYKPSSLKVDSLLFGEDGVAKKLGGISTYNIVAAESDDKPPKDLGYGYMEFVDTQGGPSSASDVMKIYKSIASAMAMSYYVGLEDVHHENVITKKDSIQVIDMEATNGVFTMPDPSKESTGGAFIDQQWGKAMDGFKASILKVIESKQLTELPDDNLIENEMVSAFTAVANNLSKKTLEKDLKRLEAALAGQRTRIVPIETAAFQTGIITFAQADTYLLTTDEMTEDGRRKKVEVPANLQNWIKFVDEKLKAEEDDVEQGGSGSTTFLGNAKGTTTTPLKTLRNLLVSPGVWKALRRGDVPYYLRDLGSSDVYDEENNRISVPGLKKVGRSIATEMAERRNAPVDDVVRVFKAQGVRLVKIMNKDLRAQLNA